MAAALVVAFVSLRCMELIDVYCQSRLQLVLHAGLALLAALRPGLPRATLLAVLYGVMRHRLDAQVRVGLGFGLGFGFGFGFGSG